MTTQQKTLYVGKVVDRLYGLNHPSVINISLMGYFEASQYAVMLYSNGIKPKKRHPRIYTDEHMMCFGVAAFSKAMSCLKLHSSVNVLQEWSAYKAWMRLV